MTVLTCRDLARSTTSTDARGSISRTSIASPIRGNALLTEFENAAALLPEAIKTRRCSCVINTETYLPDPSTETRVPVPESSHCHATALAKSKPPQAETEPGRYDLLMDRMRLRFHQSSAAS